MWPYTGRILSVKLCGFSEKLPVFQLISPSNTDKCPLVLLIKDFSLKEQIFDENDRFCMHHVAALKSPNRYCWIWLKICGLTFGLKYSKMNMALPSLLSKFIPINSTFKLFISIVLPALQFYILFHFPLPLFIFQFFVLVQLAFHFFIPIVILKFQLFLPIIQLAFQLIVP